MYAYEKICFKKAKQRRKQRQLLAGIDQLSAPVVRLSNFLVRFFRGKTVKDFLAENEEIKRKSKLSTVLLPARGKELFGEK